LPKIESNSLHIPDLHFPQAGVVVLIEVDVDGEMGVDVAHLVLVALCHANDEVVDQRSDGAEGSDVFPCAMVEFDIDDARRGMGERDSEMAEILGELAYGCRISYGGFGGLWRGLKVPLGPSTVTTRVLMWTLTPSGTASDSCE
jgi:hypothetical protein